MGFIALCQFIQTWGGVSKQLSSLYTNNNGSQKTINNAYANINGVNKEIFCPIYSWIKYTYSGASKTEGYPYKYSVSEKSDSDISEYVLQSGIYLSTSYSINESTKTISLNNAKYLYLDDNAVTIHFNNNTSAYKDLKSIATTPQYMLLNSSKTKGVSELNYSDLQYTYGYQISNITVNPTDVKVTGYISNYSRRLMTYKTQEIVYSTDKNAYASYNGIYINKLGSNFYYEIHYGGDPGSGTTYFYKALF